MKTQNEKYSLITGASDGIGKCLAVECAGRGHNLVLVALPGTGLVQLKNELEREYGVHVLACEMDLTLEGSCTALHGKVKAEGILVNLLVNNAGIGYEGKFESLPIEFCDKLMKLNTGVVVMLTRLFLDDLLQCENSTILNVSSLASFSPMPYKSMYAASKTFVYSFSRALRVELRDTNVRVCVLCPGPVPTNAGVKHRIACHGLIPKLTSVSPQKVAFDCLQSIEHKGTVIIPGMLNRITRFLMLSVPDTLKLHLVGRKFGRVPAATA